MQTRLATILWSLTERQPPLRGEDRKNAILEAAHILDETNFIPKHTICGWLARVVGFPADRTIRKVLPQKYKNERQANIYRKKYGNV